MLSCDDGDLLPVHDPAKESKDRGGRLGVEPAASVVHQYEGPVIGDYPCDGNPLSLSSRKLVRALTGPGWEGPTSSPDWVATDRRQQVIARGTAVTFMTSTVVAVYPLRGYDQRDCPKL